MGQDRTRDHPMKVTVVGGGSTYTPELVDGIARLRERLDVSELVLTDPARGRLDLVGGVARRMFAREGHPGRVVTTTDLDAAVDGADVVLLQLRVGGQAARGTDETFPLECGCVGQETTGAGGLAKALRTVPVVLRVAEAVRRRASPDAWVVDFTNPVGIVTRALLDSGHRAIGLCNVAIGFQRFTADLLGRRSCRRVARPRRPEPPHLGATCPPGRRGRAARHAGRARGRDRRASSVVAEPRSRPGDDPLVLPAVLLRPRPGGDGAAFRAVEGRAGLRDRA